MDEKRKQRNKYRQIHDWVSRKFGTPIVCEKCGKEDGRSHRIHWANKDHRYLKRRSDWMRLCTKCHGEYDKARRQLIRDKTKKVMKKEVIMKKAKTKGGAIDFVRRRFWSHGYSVKTLTNGEGFDILVNGEVKVLVLAKQPGKEDFSGIDMIAYVFRDKLSGHEVVYFDIPEVEGFYKNPKEALAEVSIIKAKYKTHE